MIGFSLREWRLAIRRVAFACALAAVLMRFFNSRRHMSPSSGARVKTEFLVLMTTFEVPLKLLPRAGSVLHVSSEG